MKKSIYLLALALSAGTLTASAQLAKGNLLVGASVGSVSGYFQDGASSVSLQLNPKLGYFLTNQFAVGIGLQLGVSGSNGVTTLNYGLLPFARYYFSQKPSGSPRLRMFGEADFGLSGVNTLKSGSNTSTNGVSFSAGPGLAYFIADNVGLETLLKARGITGFGNSAFAFQPELTVGFQIYLPASRARKLYRDEKGNNNSGGTDKRKKTKGDGDDE